MKADMVEGESIDFARKWKYCIQVSFLGGLLGIVSNKLILANNMGRELTMKNGNMQGMPCL